MGLDNIFNPTRTSIADNSIEGRRRRRL